MPLKPDTLALTALLALLTALGPLATDMYLPSLPGLTVVFATSVSVTQLTLSLFLAGFAAGQLIYGPIADRAGRRPVLLASLAIVLAADVACTLAPSIEALIVARLAQGIGTAGPIVLARAIVRDLYAGARAGQELSRMGTIMGFVPALAPFLGSLIHAAFGWRMTFGVQAGLALAIAAMVYVALPETIAQRRRTDPLTLAAFARTYAGLMQDRVYRLFVAAAAAIYCGLFAFISVSSFVLQQVYGQSEIAFGISFGLCALSYVVGTMAGTRLVARVGIVRCVTLGAAVMSAGGGVMLVLALAVASHAAEIVGPMMLFMVGLGIGFPQSIAGAMMPYPERAGAASSLLGFVQMTTAAALGVLVAAAFNDTGVPLAVAVFALGSVALLLSLRIPAARPAR